MSVNPYDAEKYVSDFWFSCMIIEPEAMSPMVRGKQDYLYKSQSGKSYPHEIFDAMAAFNADGILIRKPIHMQMLDWRYPFESLMINIFSTA